MSIVFEIVLLMYYIIVQKFFFCFSMENMQMCDVTFGMDFI